MGNKFYGHKIGGSIPMKEPDPKWGIAEREARKALNCLRWEVEPLIANDIIDKCLLAFEELRNHESVDS